MNNHLLREKVWLDELSLPENRDKLSKGASWKVDVEKIINFLPIFFLFWM